MLRSPPARWLVDQQGRGVSDLATVVGWPTLPFRIVSALPLDGKPPSPTFPAVAFVDAQGMPLADPTDGSVVGEPPLYVHRLLAATRTWDTRGL